MPLDQICIPSPDVYEGINLDSEADLERLTSLITSEQAPLVVIDSLGTAHGRDENSSFMGHALRKLADVAARTGAAIVVVHHTSKIAFDGTPTLGSIRGSGSISAMARSVIALDKPDKGSAVVRARVIKSNLCAPPAPLAFKMTGSGLERARIPSPPAKKEKQSALDKAKQFLTTYLSGGSKWANDVESAARAQQVSAKTLTRAKDELGVQSSKSGKKWRWQLPDGEDGQEATAE